MIQARTNFHESSVPSPFAPVRSQAEVAAILGIAQNTVSEAEKRALRKIKDELLRVYGSPRKVYEVNDG